MTKTEHEDEMVRLRTIRMPTLANVGRPEALSRAEWEKLSRLCAVIEKDGAAQINGRRKARQLAGDSPSVIRGDVERWVTRCMEEEGIGTEEWVINATLIPDREDPLSLADWKVTLWCRRLHKPEAGTGGKHVPTISEKVGETEAIREAGRILVAEVKEENARALEEAQNPLRSLYSAQHACGECGHCTFIQRPDLPRPNMEECWLCHLVREAPLVSPVTKITHGQLMGPGEVRAYLEEQVNAPRPEGYLPSAADQEKADRLAGKPPRVALMEDGVLWATPSYSLTEAQFAVLKKLGEPPHTLVYAEGDPNKGRVCDRCGLPIPQGCRYVHADWCEEKQRERIASIKEALKGPSGDIELRVETLEPTGKTLTLPEHLRWDPKDPSKGIGKQAAFIPARPATEEEIAAIAMRGRRKADGTVEVDSFDLVQQSADHHARLGPKSVSMVKPTEQPLHELVADRRAIEIARQRSEARALPTPRYDAQARRMTLCQSDDDGDCTWEGCPQTRDGEPAKSGRHCPYDREPSYEGQPVEEAVREVGQPMRTATCRWCKTEMVVGPRGRRTCSAAGSPCEPEEA